MADQRLDILIYAHDGRGLGHVSRSVAVGLALRRRHPERKVLLVSGSRETGGLIGPLPLDWVKLPAYATRVASGRSTGIDGVSGFEDAHLGRVRSRMIRDLVRACRPRCILVDHSPQGKHRELAEAIETTRNEDTRWILGVRAVVGDVRQVWSDAAGSLFRKRYTGLLWYGDSRVLETDAKTQLAGHFGSEPVETGYVSRLSEWVAAGAASPGQGPKRGGVAAFPWLTAVSEVPLRSLAELAASGFGGISEWRVFVDPRNPEPGASAAVGALERVPGVTVRAPGDGYLEALLSARIAIVYGGYNSLTDVLFARIPAVVLLRNMSEGEQRDHLRRIQPETLPMSVLAEDAATPRRLGSRIRQLLAAREPGTITVNLQGAATAADWLCNPPEGWEGSGGCGQG